LRSNVIGVMAGAVFGFAAMLSAFIDGPPGLIAGLLSGCLTGLIAAKLSQNGDVGRGKLSAALSIIVSWIIGSVVFIVITWLVLFTFAHTVSGWTVS
jgi:hypothetical protein